jgi:hypothetical protein
MKTNTIRRAVLSVGVAFLSCTREKPKQSVESCDVMVQGTTIQYKGHPLPTLGTLSDWESVLGTHSRKIEVYSDVYVWDGLGIFIGTQSGTSKQRGSDNSGRKSPAYWPRSTFKGRLCVDGGEISSTSSIAAVNRYKSGEPFSAGPLEHSYDYTLSTKPVNVLVGLSLSADWTPEIFEMDFSE